MRELAWVVEIVPAPVDRVWALVADFGAPQKLAASIERCEVTGTGVGAVRVVHARGLEIHERLVEADRRAHRLRYEILPSGDMPFPGLTRYVATVMLEPVSGTETRVDWRSEGDVIGDAAQLTAMLVRLYTGAISSLRELTCRGRQ